MRLLICDDHKLFTDALAMALTNSGQTVVATAFDPDEAVAAVREHRPDACLLDLYFPNGSGFDAIEQIHEVSPETKIVILSGTIRTRLVREAINLGAQGFVCKTEPVHVIVEALELALQGQLAVDPVILQQLFNPGGDDLDQSRGLKFLTGREWEVLGFIMDGLSTKQMADRFDVQPNTARRHLHNLFTKLGVHTRRQAAALMTAHASAGTWPAHLRQRTKGPDGPPGQSHSHG